MRRRGGFDKAYRQIYYDDDRVAMASIPSVLFSGSEPLGFLQSLRPLLLIQVCSEVDSQPNLEALLCLSDCNCHLLNILIQYRLAEIRSFIQRQRLSISEWRGL